MAVKRTRIEQAEFDRVQAERVSAMIGQLRGLLTGRSTRAEVLAWAHELWPPGSGQGGPFRWAMAACVFASILSLHERHADRELVRERDLRAYLRWLSEGELFHADDDAVINLAGEIEAFAARTGGEVVRWWFDGIGWVQTVHFCAPGSGRPFVVHSMLERPTGLGFCKLRSDDWTEAAIDLFEALAIDDDDVYYLNPAIDRARLPVWALWRQDDSGNHFEIAQFRSYAKACAQQRMYTQRGHKQMYWVDPA